MESIFDGVKNAAIIHKSEGHWLFVLAAQAKGDVVGSTKGISSGPVIVHGRFSIRHRSGQAGGTRGAPTWGLLRVDHPDISSSSHARTITTSSTTSIYP